MKLFPHILIRISGGAFEQLESLNLKESLRIIDDICKLKKSLAHVKEKISQQLYQIIPQTKDPKIQNLLLNFRRDIFNERDISSGDLDDIITNLPASINIDIKKYLGKKGCIEKLCGKGKDIFAEEVTRLRKNLHALASDEKLQKGLLLSSQSLLKRIPSYIARESHLQKKDFQTERGLIKYISRMYAKTSPFSTFTNLVLGKPVSPPEGKKSFLWAESLKKIGPINHIRLNNFLYDYLRILLCKNPDIYPLFLIRPNPTLEKGETHYLYLTNNNNIEAFQRIPANPALEVFRRLTAERKEGIPFHRLVREIIDNQYIDAPAEDIRSYIDQLIEYGFLEYNIGVSGIDPDWDIKLGNVLKGINSNDVNIPLLVELSEVLVKLRSLAGEYGEAPFRKRNEILEDAFRRFKGFCMKLHKAAGLPGEERKSPEERMQTVKKEKKENAEAGAGEKEDEEVFKHESNTYFYFKPEQMFYEDTTANISPLVDEKSLEAFISSLHGLLQQLRHFEGHREEQDKMRHFFIEKYGKKASVELMTFYEEYYREFKKPEAELLQKKEETKNALLTVPEVTERQEKNKGWLNRFTAIVSKGMSKRNCLRLSLRQLTRTHEEFPLEIESCGTGCSYGSFIQFYLEKKGDGEEKLMGVLNASFPGFGKLFSRFLHIFDDTVTRDMRKWNESLAGDFLLAEDCDASYFNANLHPPLMPYEVRIPGGHNSLPPEYQLPITEMQVRLDESGKRLQLIHKPTRKRVYVFDLGFQGHKGRSQLFRLLEKFTMAEILYPLPLLNAVAGIGQKSREEEEKKTGGAEIRVDPRVVYDDRIVLRRKTWHIPREKLPYKTPGESNWDYFLRLNEWRRELRLPEEVFVYVVDRFRTSGAKPGSPKKEKQILKISRDDYKPQYISFNNPFLADLFERIIKRVPVSLKMVEMLPDSRQLLRIGESKHITEFTVQWYTHAQSQGN